MLSITNYQRNVNKNYNGEKKNKEPSQRLARRPEQTFLQRRYTYGQQRHERMLNIVYYSAHFSSVAQSCLSLCNPMNCSMSGLPVHHQLLELAQTQVHRVSDAKGWGQSLTKIIKIQFYYKIENKSKDRGQEKRQKYISDDNRN